MMNAEQLMQAMFRTVTEKPTPALKHDRCITM
jgi:hypothetical protein